MALQSSGTISIADIAAEFGGGTPHSLNEYYAAAPGVPTSGTISNSDFYGKSLWDNEFSVVTYSGTGSTNVVSIPELTTGIDFIWIKGRSNTGAPNIIDSLRGDNKVLYTHGTGQESTEQSFSFSTSTFTTNGSHGGSWNDSGATYVAWCATLPTDWSNNAGSNGASLTSTGKKNSFMSASKYTGNITGGATVGHGLGSTPEMIIFKNYGATASWHVYHKDIPNAQNALLYLDTSGTPGVTSQFLQGTLPNSSIITLGDSGGTNGIQGMITYSFKSVSGKCDIGSYTGISGTKTLNFGFEPQFVMIKNINASEPWFMFDTERVDDDGESLYLLANATDVESTDESSPNIKLTATGVSIETTYGGVNGPAGNTFAYVAIAKNP